MKNVTLDFEDAIANSDSRKHLKGLLEFEKLCYDDLDTIKGVLQAVRSEEGIVIGGYGLEFFGKDALFRSVVVNREFRNYGIGKEIVKEALSKASKKRIENKYLLTTTADKFFKKFDFLVIPRNSVPETIANTTEFKTFCPDTAVCMKCIL